MAGSSGGNGAGGSAGSDAAAADSTSSAAGGTAAPPTPPLVQPQRSADSPHHAVDFEDSDYGDAHSWGGSPESSMSAYYSPRRAESGALSESPPRGPLQQGPTAAFSAPAAADGAELMRQHALRRQLSLRRRKKQREQLTLRTAGPARVRSFEVHPAMKSALAAAQREQARLILPAAEAGALPGVMPLAEPLLADHRPAFAESGERIPRLQGPPRLETSPLLSGDADALDAVEDEDDEGASSEDEEDVALEGGSYGPESFAEYRAEGMRLLKMAGPLAAQNVASQGSFYISQAFAGRLGRDSLSAACLGTSILNVTGFAALAGLASAMETLCGQAYGAKNYAAVGITLQRALLICLVALAAMLPLWFSMEHVLLALGQKPRLARDAAEFVWLSVPAVFFTGIAECLKRYLMAQGVVMPAAVASTVSTLLAPVYNYILIFSCGFGLDGAAYANDAIFLTTALLLGGWTIWYDHAVEGRPEDTWQGWSFQCFRGWGTYVAIAVPSCVMVCMEWWSVECLIILAGLLPDASLSVAVTGICLNIMGLIYMMSFGLSGASSTRVSNALGGGRPRAARRTARMSGVLTLAGTTIAAVLLLVFRNQVGRIFAHDDGVVDAVAALAWLLAIVVIGDGLNATYSGVIRGAARQNLGVIVNLGAYWVFGIPLSVALGLWAGWGVRGFWIGMAVTTTVQGGIMAWVALRLDWAGEARRAAALLATHTALLRDTEPPAPQQPHKVYLEDELDA